MITTDKTNTLWGKWPMTKENTYYGYKVGEEYHWYKSRATVKRHIKNTKIEYHRATLIKNKMFINLIYLTLYGWR